MTFLGLSIFKKWLLKPENKILLEHSHTYLLIKELKLQASLGDSTAVIPALWKTEMRGSRGQEFKISLAKIVKPCLY